MKNKETKVVQNKKNRGKSLAKLGLTFSLGFTLVELLTVVALLGVLAVSVESKGPSPSTARLEAAGRQVATHLEFAKHNAVATRQSSGISFVGSGAYTVYQGSTSTPLKSPLTQEDIVVTLSTFYPGISIVGDYTVEFDKWGAPSSGGGGAVTLTDGISARAILVTANTGKVARQ